MKNTKVIVAKVFSFLPQLPVCEPQQTQFFLSNKLKLLDCIPHRRLKE
jgi:hypothetical protein